MKQKFRIILYVASMSTALSCTSIQQKEQLIVDRLEIEDTMTALFVNTDSKNWQGVQDTFAEQVTFDMSSLTKESAKVVTPKQIADTWTQGLKDIPTVHHQGGNYRVQIHGNSADAQAYGIAFHYKKKPDGKNSRTFVGNYDYHFKKINGRWKIDLFRFNLKFIDGNLAL